MSSLFLLESNNQYVSFTYLMTPLWIILGAFWHQGDLFKFLVKKATAAQEPLTSLADSVGCSEYLSLSVRKEPTCAVEEDIYDKSWWKATAYSTSALCEAELHQ